MANFDQLRRTLRPQGAIALLRHPEAALDGLDIGRTAQCASLIAPYALGIEFYWPRVSIAEVVQLAFALDYPVIFIPKSERTYVSKHTRKIWYLMTG
jgi:hypothetical protein